MKAVWTGVLTAAAVVLFSGSVYAQTTDTVNISAVINAKAKLDVSAGPVTFPDDDPDAAAILISATPITVSAKARTTAAGSVTLTVAADGDLMSGTDPIGIGNLTWTAGGDLSGGTMNTTGATLGSWTGPGMRSGTQTYRLANSWSYVPGTYTAIITYTLTAP